MSYEITIEIDIWEEGENGEHLGYGFEEYKVRDSEFNTGVPDVVARLAKFALKEAQEAAFGFSDDN